MSIKIEEISSKLERIALHSHIKGLGVINKQVKFIADGFVGQIEAREAAYYVTKLIKEGKFGGKGVLFVGPPGTGKTALAVGIARELGLNTPFVQLSAAEVFSLEIKKTEFLTRALRRGIGIKLREIRKVYEGVVKKIDYRFGRNPYNPYAQMPISATITLRTKHEEKTLRVPAEIAQQLAENNIDSGDVIWIDEETGKIFVQGKAEEESEETYDIYVRKKIEVPSGPVYKDKEITRYFTCHDLDTLNARQQGLLSMLMFGTSGEEKEIPDEVRKAVDEFITKSVNEGKGELIPGVVFVDDAHMLDIETWAFLARAMESELTPILIFATNRGFTKIRGTDVESPHGIPLDLLDRLVIIRTRNYNYEEIKEIIKIRAKEEKVEIEEDAIDYLAKIGEEHSLRYSVQLLAPSFIRSKEKGNKKVTKEDIEYVKKLFVSLKESVDYIKQHEKFFLK